MVRDAQTRLSSDQHAEVCRQISLGRYDSVSSFLRDAVRRRIMELTRLDQSPAQAALMPVEAHSVPFERARKRGDIYPEAGAWKCTASGTSLVWDGVVHGCRHCNLVVEGAPVDASNH